MQSPFLFLVAVASIIVSIATRKEAFGGWLLYFYFWIFAVVCTSFRDLLLNLNVFRPSYGHVNHEALVLAVFPRTLVYLAIAAIAVVLWRESEWVWVERLRVTLIAGVIIAGLSLWLDFRYFPSSLRFNAARWFGLCFWLTYFSVSNRVHHVFRTKDWASAREIAG